MILVTIGVDEDTGWRKVIDARHVASPSSRPHPKRERLRLQRWLDERRFERDKHRLLALAEAAGRARS